MVELREPSLLREACHVGGQWVAAEDGATMPVTDPATGQTIATVPSGGAKLARRAVEAAAEALPGWRALLAQERADLLLRWHDLICAHREDLARLMTCEQGKPIRESRAEIDYAASFVRWFAEEARRIYGETIPQHRHGARLVVIRQPVGVCAAITPWNFPSAMITRKVAPALAAGCTVVVKPAEQTPLSALALAVLAEQAGLPPGVFNVVTGDPEAIGDVLCSHEQVRKLSFTGSTEVGRLLMRKCAENLLRLSLELGGNAPFLVFPDADLDAAVADVMASKYRNSGQTCVCANRIAVHAEVHDAFVERLTAASRRLKVGPGLDEDTDQGPLIDADAVAKVEHLLADARSRGATVHCGGKRHALGGTFFEPTVVSGVRQDMALFRTEIFGPVAPVYRFRDEAEAIAFANAVPQGLAAYVHTRDVGRVWRLAEAIEAGMVGINTGMISTAVAPFGGVKHSGFGREGSRHGIDEYVELKYLCIGGIDDAPAG